MIVHRSFVLLKIISDSYVTHTGFLKVSHSFQNLGTFDSLDSVVLYIFGLSDGYFRVLARTNKKLKTYNVRKHDNLIDFT